MSISLFISKYCAEQSTTASTHFDNYNGEPHRRSYHVSRSFGQQRPGRLPQRYYRCTCDGQAELWDRLQGYGVFPLASKSHVFGLTAPIAGELQSVDGYMNIALEKCEEYVNGRLRRTYGDAFVRGNNGQFALQAKL